MDLSDLFQHSNQNFLLINQFQNRTSQTKESIQQNIQSLLQFKYRNIVNEGDQLIDVTDQLQNILNYSEVLQKKFEQSQKLQQKLRDIEEELQSYFQCKQNFIEIIEEYKQSLEKYKEMKQNVKEFSQNDLPRQDAQNRLQEYASLIKKLKDYSTFKNELNDLKKIDKRFQILEQEEDYLEYYLQVNNKLQEQITLSDTQLLCHFVQMLGQSISYLKSHQNCSVIIYYEDKKNISEEVLMQYKYAILLKIYDMVPTLILIDKENSDAQVICASQHRQQNKLYLENYKNYLSNIKPSYTLLKPDIILGSTFTKIIEKLIQINMINQIRNITYQEMLENTKKILLYQQGLEQLDCFQFLDTMQIELN
ncbi:unnamed protein product [Paramecium primaurelia]|uniref:Uncharacterized protein n=1 Tax=Paramecium primaurelia TaxID=5886 RepID=A0A8S1MZ91_PARPR|nr:unnamed protein product [Paramecium primaurelia]